MKLVQRFRILASAAQLFTTFGQCHGGLLVTARCKRRYVLILQGIKDSTPNFDIFCANRNRTNSCTKSTSSIAKQAKGKDKEYDDADLAHLAKMKEEAKKKKEMAEKLKGGKKG